MAKYSAINIGPIIHTLNMARKPRGLWAASYMFSYLMECIIKALPEDSIISPAIKADIRSSVGLYPDRVYLKGNVDTQKVETAVCKCAERINVNRDYFNIMYSCVDVDSVSTAIEQLNKDLDIKELFNHATSASAEKSVEDLLSEKYGSPLFDIAFGTREFEVDTIENIAKSTPHKEFSYSKYFCVVQADGDNMGSTIAQADEKTIHNISNALLKFGTEAVEEIRVYSDCNLPLYAGGDDLLFIVPVVGKEMNIFELIKKIDTIFTTHLAEIAPNTSMSYGISINYHKYPLYETLESARNLLFDKAKNVPGKNAIAWSLRKHSGGSFYGECSKDGAVFDAFCKVIMKSDQDAAVVSAVSHKIRSNEGLLKLWYNKNDNYRKRNSWFFEKNMDGVEKEGYKKSALMLLNELYAFMLKENGSNDNKKDNYTISDVVKSMYGMLRTAKFVKGENGND